MIDPEDADYRCTLTAASLEKAIRERHEDPKQRLGAVQTLQERVKEQKHFTCRTGGKGRFKRLNFRRNKYFRSCL